MDRNDYLEGMIDPRLSSLQRYIRTLVPMSLMSVMTFVTSKILVYLVSYKWGNDAWERCMHRSIYSLSGQLPHEVDDVGVVSQVVI